MIVYLFLSLFIGTFVYIFFSFFKNRIFSKKELLIVSLVMIISLCGIAYCIVPGKTSDLYNHFYTLKDINLYGFGIKTAVDNLFVIKLLFFLVAKLNNYQLLSMFTILITYGIYFLLFYKFHQLNKNVKKVDSLHFLILFFALCNFYYVSTGIKTGIAYSILALSIYLIESKKSILGYIMMFTSLFCHGSALVLILLYLLNKINLFRKCRFGLLFTFLGAKVISSLLSKIPVSFISYIGSKISFYINRSTFTSNKIILITEIVFAIFLIYRCQKIIKGEDYKEKYNINYIYFLQTLVLLGLGTIFVSDVILERMLMLIAFLIPTLLIPEKKQKRLIYIFFDLISSIILIGYFLIRLVNHITFL